MEEREAIGCPTCGAPADKVIAKRAVRECVYSDGHGVEAPLAAEVTEYTCGACGATWLADDAQAAFEAEIPAAVHAVERRSKLKAAWWLITRAVGVLLQLTIVIGPIVLKWKGWLHWSWWWVTAPLWLTAAVIVLALVILLVTFGKSPHR